ncbi:hypothetical protein GCM10027176_10150 [Actinoallomurus bryophytorum]|uniref:Uncharacterized protein n=1 Tax=Actinoallomurus bryophytorum TaxID=1490222 RepID=A0A543BZG8_9ACTN|nr:hypothetical protein [Actinoallomurus bryophytorum]TQL90222.1 hypothetical protein FB559_7515 [Actinoallomurus bryophytorum]
MTPPAGRYAELTRAELAVVVPELLLIGHLIDRAGMAWCISAFGREEMVRIAIEEWAGASPIYTRRMQRALRFAPVTPGEGDVITIFKGLQLDIGAPPQFMDFRFTVHDARHGEFQLDHCGALMDVEPMGEEYVVGMCHDIEDPTFDATAIASHPRAQVRPVHRPPRVPAGRRPHCAWTVVIDDSHPEAVPVPALSTNASSRASTLDLAPIDPSDDGAADYAGPLLSDLDFSAFSRSALIRIADEVCLQMALLDNSFALAVAARADSADTVRTIRRRQLVGFAGIAAHRLARALGLPHTEAGALRLLALHPVLNPGAYVHAEIVDGAIVVRRSPAHADGAWISLCGPDWAAALQAIVRVLDPRLDVELEPSADAAWRLRVVRRDVHTPEAQEVTVAKFSTGTDFAFEHRRSLPITPV